MTKRKQLPRKGTLERARLDAFFGGYCCCLSAACYGDDGTTTEYIEAVGACGPDDLLAYAIREGESELPKIRRAVRSIRARDERMRRAIARANEAREEVST